MQKNQSTPFPVRTVNSNLDHSTQHARTESASLQVEGERKGVSMKTTESKRKSAKVRQKRKHVERQRKRDRNEQIKKDMEGEGTLETENEVNNL